MRLAVNQEVAGSNPAPGAKSRIVMETTRGAWCQWYVTGNYLIDAMCQLEDGGVRQEYIHITQMDEHPIDRAKNLYLVLYRNPPYRSESK